MSPGEDPDRFAAVLHQHAADAMFFLIRAASDGRPEHATARAAMEV
jgi:hypothetical protein